jgi:hypothetical protein
MIRLNHSRPNNPLTPTLQVQGVYMAEHDGRLLRDRGVWVHLGGATIVSYKQYRHAESDRD